MRKDRRHFNCPPERATDASLEPLAWLCGCGNAFPALMLFGVFLWSSLRTEDPSA